MKIARVALVLGMALGACGDKARHEDNHAETATAHEGSGDVHDEPAALGPEHIRIAPDMLRDLRVTLGKAHTRATGETVSALGELSVNEDAYAEVSAPVLARVAKVRARPGDQVTAGQVLAELTSPDLGQARAEASAARARLGLATAAAARKQALVADRLVPERELVEAETARAEADASAKIAAAALARFSGATGGSGLLIKSPIAGTVIDRNVVIGHLADPAKTLFRIGDLSTLWLIAHVFERDAVRVQVGRVATVSFAALPGRTVEAAVQWIGREVEKESRTIAIRLDVANADGVLRPGMSATVAVPLGDVGGAPIVVIPAAAVQRVGATWAVFLPRGEGTFEIRPIGRGRDLAGEIEVLSGLTVEENVVLDGAFLLKAEADKQRGGGGDHDH